MSFGTWLNSSTVQSLLLLTDKQDINNKKLFIIDLNTGPNSVRTIDTKQPIGVTANIEGVDSSEVILAGAKDGVTKFNLKSGEHEYVAKFWKGPDAEEKAKM